MAFGVPRQTKAKAGVTTTSALASHHIVSAPRVLTKRPERMPTLPLWTREI
jgi:hypothetical protein